MTGGLALVRAHLDSFVAGRVEDFDHQLAPTFRYQFLPPIMGQGPPQARRWFTLLTSIYRDWSYEAESATEVSDLVTLRVSFVGLDPVEPENTIDYFYDPCVMEFAMKHGLLTGCASLYLPFQAHETKPAAA